MERGFRLIMTNESTHALGERFGKKMEWEDTPGHM